MLAAGGGVQWPFPPKGSVKSNMRLSEESAARSGSDGNGAPGTAPPVRERRLFEDGRFFTADSKARFIFEEPRTAPEMPDAEFPFVLLTGRSSTAQWHTLTRTAKSEILRRLSPSELLLELNPEDGKRLGLRQRSKVRVESRRGGLQARVVLTASVARGQVFLPMHDAATNLLTLPVVDPYSRQPAYKHCAVRVERIAR